MCEKKIVMLGTSFDGKGGVSSVVNVYKQAGLFSRWDIIYIPTHRDGNRWTKCCIAFVAIVQFVKLLLKGRIAFVHAHTVSRSSFWRKSIFFLLSFAARCPVVLHLHSAEFKQFYSQESNKFTKYYIRYILKRVSSIVVLSSQWKEFVSGIVCNANINTIFNPVSPNVFSYSARSRQENLLLFLGRLGKRKGIYDLLLSIKQLRPSFPDIRLLCGGDGDLAGVRRRAVELGIESSVEVLGWVRGSVKKGLFEKASVYVLPSYNEGLPMGVLEGMAAGLPVISTPVGGIPDAVQNGVEGFLVPPGDVTELTGAIRKLLGDAELRGKMGAAAKRRIDEQFAHMRVIPQIETMYRDFGLSPTLEDQI